MAAKCEVSESNGQFRRKAANGATGESYKTRPGAHDGCEAVKSTAAAANIDDV
jgi:uncharacterized protein YegP (UPF0339 family)